MAYSRHNYHCWECIWSTLSKQHMNQALWPLTSFQLQANDKVTTLESSWLHFLDFISRWTATGSLTGANYTCLRASSAQLTVVLLPQHCALVCIGEVAARFMTLYHIKFKFFKLVGWDFWYCGHYWPIVPAPEYRWWWLWRKACSTNGGDEECI
jgi:hypothetical protein